METYGRRLSHALALADKTRVELAEHLGVSVQAVGAVARDESTAFKAPHSAHAAAFLRVDHFWLATGHGEPRPGAFMSPLAADIAQAFDRVPLANRQRVHALVMQTIDLATQVREPTVEPVLPPKQRQLPRT